MIPRIPNKPGRRRFLECEIQIALMMMQKKCGVEEVTSTLKGLNSLKEGWALYWKLKAEQQKDSNPLFTTTAMPSRACDCLACPLGPSAGVGAERGDAT